MRAELVALTAGVLFAAGLVVSGMAQPSKVIGFLDVSGAWDPSLAFVMAGAIGVHALAYRWIRRRAKPLFAAELAVPASQGIDARLLAGAALFGIGWGLGGFCPGPALVSLMSGAPKAVVFVAAMLAGMYVHRFVPAPRSR